MWNSCNGWYFGIRAHVKSTCRGYEYENVFLRIKSILTYGCSDLFALDGERLRVHQVNNLPRRFDRAINVS